MISDLLKERCALFAAGALTAAEREQFEIIVEFHPEVRQFLAWVEEAAVAIVLAHLNEREARPANLLKTKILGSLREQRSERPAESFVMCEKDGLVQWVNPAFTSMCGYTLEELRGKNLGPILQGEGTDAATAERMRKAVRAQQPCQETILNYHKNGNPYLVEIAITPILDSTGEALWLIATERECSEKQV